MHLYENLTQLLAEARTKDRQIRCIDGDKDESVVEFSELWMDSNPQRYALRHISPDSWPI